LKKTANIFFIFNLVVLCALAQVNTYSPYSRFGLGELNQPSLAHNQGMGGAFAALKPDSVFPVMINTGNPASYALIKFASFEVGGFYNRSNFTTQEMTLVKNNANFAYAVLGFPIRKNGGAVLGLLPYSNVGYNLSSQSDVPSIGPITYNYNGEGGFSKVFTGYGIMPFKERMINFRKKQNRLLDDSTYTFHKGKEKTKEFFNELLSDFTLGANLNYMFGSVKNYADIRYPNSTQYYNTIREQFIRINDFTGTLGAQTAFTIDSVKKKVKLDTLGNTVVKKVAMREKIKIVFGWYMGLNNTITARRDMVSYTYFLTANAMKLPRDTIQQTMDEYGQIKLPLEQGFGIGFKKGEKFNLVVDYAITNWSQFKMFEYTNNLKNNSRAAVGFNYVPEKFATGKGTYFKRSQYRAGAFYQSGYIDINQTPIATYGLTAGISIPVGIRTGTGLISVGLQAGQTGSSGSGLVKQDFYRVNIGFTFNSTYFDDLWFRKFKYD